MPQLGLAPRSPINGSAILHLAAAIRSARPELPAHDRSRLLLRVIQAVEAPVPACPACNGTLRVFVSGSTGRIAFGGFRACPLCTNRS